jgi:hypothetical protein
MGEWRFSSSILDWALVECEWSASRLGRLILCETALGTHWIGGWMGPRGGLDTVEKRQIFPLSVIESQPSSPSLWRLSYPISSEYTT